MDASAIQKVIHDAGAQFKACYAAALKKKKGLSGRVETRFVIDETGHVVSTEDVTRSNVLQDDDARACVLARFKGLVFPPPQPSGRVPITYPLLFDPASLTDDTSSAPEVDSPYNRERKPFDPGIVSAALAAVDVAPCTTAGAPAWHGQGHARLTFDPSGVVLRAEVDAPAKIPPVVAACVVKAYRAVHVPVFAGDVTTVGKNFVVP